MSKLGKDSSNEEIQGELGKLERIRRRWFGSGYRPFIGGDPSSLCIGRTFWISFHGQI